MEMSANTFLLIQDQWEGMMLSGLAAEVRVCLSCIPVSEASAELRLWTMRLGLHLWHTAVHLCTCTRLLWHACLFLLNETFKKAHRKMGLCWFNRGWKWPDASLPSLISPSHSKSLVSFIFLHDWIFLPFHKMQPAITRLVYNIMTHQRSVQWSQLWWVPGRYTYSVVKVAL